MLGALKRFEADERASCVVRRVRLRASWSLACVVRRAWCVLRRASCVVLACVVRPVSCCLRHEKLKKNECGEPSSVQMESHSAD